MPPPHSSGTQGQQDPTATNRSRTGRSQHLGQADRDSSTRRIPSRSRSPNSRLTRHLRTLMQQQGLEFMVHYTIPPNPSTFLRSSLFTVNELQPNGLLNDGNVCPIISIILCFHRLRIKDYLKDPEYFPNLPTLVLYKILQALPSLQSFSIMQFIMSWNASNLGADIRPGQHGDVTDILDSFLTELDIKTFSARTRPVFTKYLASFSCPKCGKRYHDVERWDNQWNRKVPLLVIPENEDPVNVWNMLSTFLLSPVHTRCPDVACGQQIHDGVLVPMPGIFTVLAVNRLDLGSNHGAPSFLPNKLSIAPTSDAGTELEMVSVFFTVFSFSDAALRTSSLNGELLSVICHRGQQSNYGHFVSYHNVTGHWYLNDDDRMCRPKTNPLLQQVPTETADMLFFKTNI